VALWPDLPPCGTPSIRISEWEGARSGKGDTERDLSSPLHATRTAGSSTRGEETERLYFLGKFEQTREPFFFFEIDIYAITLLL
jgi:hypothetical protein